MQKILAMIHLYTSSNEPMENCVAPGLDEFDVLLEVVLSLVRVGCHLLST